MFNNFGAGPLESTVSMQQTVMPIISLDISQNGISKEGMQSLFRALEWNTSLVTLSIGNNEAYNSNKLGRDGVASLR